MNNLKIAKSLKLSLDTLGYAVTSEGITSDRSCYRIYLRSGLINDNKPRYTSNRDYQLKQFYKYYFNENKMWFRCDYRSVISFLIYNGVKGKPYFKPVQQVANKLFKLGYFEKYDLESGILIKDNFNKNTFYYCKLNKTLVRLVNNKSYKYEI